MSRDLLASSHQSAVMFARLAKLASTAAGSDRIFMIVQYALTLVLPSLQPATASDVRLSIPKSTDSSIKLYMSLKRLRDLCSDYRIFARLIGYPAIHTWGISNYNSQPSSQPDATPRWIEDAQVLVNLGYQPLENLAYLSTHDILPLSKSLETKLWLWSCRCWAAHVALDLYRLHLVRRQYLRSTSINEKSKKEQETISFNWVREVVINLAYAPLTIHWSLEKGLPGLTERRVGLCGVIAAVGQLSKVWETTK